LKIKQQKNKQKRDTKKNETTKIENKRTENKLKTLNIKTEVKAISKKISKSPNIINSVFNNNINYNNILIQSTTKPLIGGPRSISAHITDKGQEQSDKGSTLEEISSVALLSPACF
jgi:hypothetical protein